MLLSSLYGGADWSTQAQEEEAAKSAAQDEVTAEVHWQAWLSATHRAAIFHPKKTLPSALPHECFTSVDMHFKGKYMHRRRKQRRALRRMQ